MLWAPRNELDCLLIFATNLAANFVASNTLIAPSLGRPLSGGALSTKLRIETSRRTNAARPPAPR